MLTEKKHSTVAHMCHLFKVIFGILTRETTSMATEVCCHHLSFKGSYTCHQLLLLVHKLRCNRGLNTRKFTAHIPHELPINAELLPTFPSFTAVWDLNDFFIHNY